MSLFRMVLQGLRGRKRDTLILGCVLFLAFLFLTLSSVLLSSFAKNTELQRQALHGRWQVLYYGAEKDAEEQCAAFADCAAMEIVGTTGDGHLIGSIDETVQYIGCLQLVEGRLPQGEDEIVLVRGKMDEEPALGEEVNLCYQYSYMRGSSQAVDDQANRRQAVIDSLHAGETDAETLEKREQWDYVRQWYLSYLYRNYDPETIAEWMEGETNPYAKPTRPWEELHEQFLAYVREHYDPESNTVHFRYQHWGFNTRPEPDYYYPLPPGQDLEQTLAEDENDLLFAWATIMLHPTKMHDPFDDEAYKVSTVRALPGGLFSYEGFLINVLNEGVETLYLGWAFSDEVKAQVSEELRTSKTLLYKSYTVVGYVAPYVDHWDVHGLTLPDGFVSPEAAAAQLRALRRAEEEYYEGAPSWEPKEILLIQDPDSSWSATAARTLQVFSQVQKPYFKVEGLDETLIGKPQQGVIIGLDPETGEEKICELRQYGPVCYYLIDPLTSEQLLISGDPTAAFRWDEFSSMLLPLRPEQLTLEELEANNHHPLRLNQYSFSRYEYSLQTLCSGILICMAACSVFLVFWVQLRRRRMRLATLFAIGATDAQVFKMLLLELLVLLAVTSILGLVLGFLIARIVTAVISSVFVVEPGRLFGGLALCIAAMLVSALIPMLAVLRTPLTGREPLSRHILGMKAPQKNRRQHYARIVLRQMRANRGRTALQAAMAFLLASICLLTIFLCHSAYTGYRRKITDTAMPDYEIVVPYGMTLRALRTSLEAHPTLSENAEISAAWEAPNVWLHCDGLLETSPVAQALHEVSAPAFRDLPDGETGLAVRVVGLTDDALEAFCARLPEGSVDLPAIQKGEACLVFVPRYEAENGALLRRDTEPAALEDLRLDERAGYLLLLHYGSLYTEVSEADAGLQAGDTLTLTAYSQKIVDEHLVEESTDCSLRVEAVISTIDPPFWPLSENNAAFVLLTGQRAIAEIYPYASSRMAAARAKYHVRMAELFYPDCYGLTRILISNHKGVDAVEMDTLAYDLAEELGVELTNYRLNKSLEEAPAQNRLLLFLLLGIEMALVLSTLLYSAAIMAAEQDRFRFGLLQALGLSDGQIFWGQLLQSFGLSILGCIGANLLLGVVQLSVALFSSRPYLTLLENLEAYPWTLHLLVSLGFILVYTLLQSLPILRLGREEVIDNMRS